MSERPVIWRAGGGLAIGVINIAVIGRRFPLRYRSLPNSPTTSRSAQCWPMSSIANADTLS